MKYTTRYVTFFYLFCLFAISWINLRNLNNLIEITSDPENNLCYAKQVTGDLVLADAVGAAKGAYDGYKVGKFAGPQATVAMTALGAVCYGALSTATEAGIKQNVSRLIDKGLDGLRNKFKISL